MLDQQRVNSVANRLLSANAELCPKQRNQLGIWFYSPDLVNRKARATYSYMLGVNNKPVILQTAPNSPAARAGLLADDVIVAVNGVPVPDKKSGTSLMKMLGESQNEMMVSIRRNGQLKTLNLTKEPACAYSVIVSADDQVNAYADGNNIVVNRGLLRFVQSDDELALVLAHELAHNSEKHIDSKKTNTFLEMLGGAIIDGAFAAYGVDTGGQFTNIGGEAGRAAYSEEFEAEADYIRMYFLERAGFYLENVEFFWRRIGAANPQAVILAASHPTTAARFIRIAATRDEIRQKNSQHIALLPQRKNTDAGQVYCDGKKTDINECSTRYARNDDEKPATGSALSIADGAPTVVAISTTTTPWSSSTSAMTLVAGENRTKLGISGSTVTSASTLSREMSEPRGVYIYKISPRSYGSKMGLKTGDVILSVNGERTDNLDEVKQLLLSAPADSPVTFEIWRKQQIMSLSGN